MNLKIPDLHRIFSRRIIDSAAREIDLSGDRSEIRGPLILATGNSGIRRQSFQIID
jgi:hypothetical protein